MDKINYGVIGVGALGRHHARWVKSIPDSHLAGVYDLNRSRSDDIANECGCKSFESTEELLNHCDAVSIAAPTTCHHRIALQVIQAGKHLLVEKPISASLDEADEIVKAADAAGVKLMVGHIERFNPAIKVLDNYPLNPSFIEAHRLAKFNPRGADVAVVLDLMIHDIDLVLHLIKSPIKTIAASAVKIISDSEDISNARLTFENGAVANLTASRISLHPMRKLRIFQNSGYFSLDLAEKRADLYRMLESDPSPDELSIPLGESGRNIGYRQDGDKSLDMLESELKSFIGAIVKDRPVAVSGREGRDALAVALEVITKSRQAAETFMANG